MCRLPSVFFLSTSRYSATPTYIRCPSRPIRMTYSPTRHDSIKTWSRSWETFKSTSRSQRLCLVQWRGWNRLCLSASLLSPYLWNLAVSIYTAGRESWQRYEGNTVSDDLPINRIIYSRSAIRLASMCRSIKTWPPPQSVHSHCTSQYCTSWTFSPALWLRIEYRSLQMFCPSSRAIAWKPKWMSTKPSHPRRSRYILSNSTLADSENRAREYALRNWWCSMRREPGI